MPAPLRQSPFSPLSGGMTHASIPLSTALQVLVDHVGGALVQALAIDLQVLHDALDIVARLGERDPLDPVFTLPEPAL